MANNNNNNFQPGSMILVEIDRNMFNDLMSPQQPPQQAEPNVTTTATEATATAVDVKDDVLELTLATNTEDNKRRIVTLASIKSSDMALLDKGSILFSIMKTPNLFGAEVETRDHGEITRVDMLHVMSGIARNINWTEAFLKKVAAFIVSDLKTRRRPRRNYVNDPYANFDETAPVVPETEPLECPDDVNARDVIEMLFKLGILASPRNGNKYMTTYYENMIRNKLVYSSTGMTLKKIRESCLDSMSDVIIEETRRVVIVFTKMGSVLNNQIILGYFKESDHSHKKLEGNLAGNTYLHMSSQSYMGNLAYVIRNKPEIVDEAIAILKEVDKIEVTFELNEQTGQVILNI